MLKDATRRRFEVLLAWDVSRLGRSLRELLECFETLRKKGVDLYLDQQGVDTTTPAGRALFGMAGVFAEFERSMLIERTRAGLERARARGKRLGRPITPDHVTRRVLELRGAGMGMDRIARELGIGKSVAQRICQAMPASGVPATISGFDHLAARAPSGLKTRTAGSKRNITATLPEDMTVTSAMPA
jgi:DNA invertase Pin-like site-specific DNA recombinase